MKKSYVFLMIIMVSLFSFSGDVLAETKVGSITYDEVTKLADQGCAAVKNSNKWMHNLTSSKYTGSCMYLANVDKADGSGSACHIIEVDFGKNDVLVTEYDPIKGVEYSNKKDVYATLDGISRKVQTKFSVDSGLTAENILRYSNNEGTCFSVLRVDRKSALDPLKHTKFFVSTTVGLDTADGENYYLDYVRGNSSGTGKPLSVDSALNIEFFKKNEITNCEDLLGDEIVKMIKNCWNIVKILVPIILLVFGTLDFAKAVFSGEDSMKKAQGKFIKRVIIAVCIFIIPSVLAFLLNVGNDIFGIFGENGTDICGLLG